MDIFPQLVSHRSLVAYFEAEARVVDREKLLNSRGFINFFHYVARKCYTEDHFNSLMTYIEEPVKKQYKMKLASKRAKASNSVF